MHLSVSCKRDSVKSGEEIHGYRSHGLVTVLALSPVQQAEASSISALKFHYCHSRCAFCRSNKIFDLASLRYRVNQSLTFRRRHFPSQITVHRSKQWLWKYSRGVQKKKKKKIRIKNRDSISTDSKSVHTGHEIESYFPFSK